MGSKHIAKENQIIMRDYMIKNQENNIALKTDKEFQQDFEGMGIRCSSVYVAGIRKYYGIEPHRVANGYGKNNGHEHKQCAAKLRYLSDRIDLLITEIESLKIRVKEKEGSLI